MLASYSCGQEDMEQSTTELHTSFREQEKQCTFRSGKAQLKEQIAYYMNNAKVIKEGLKRCRIHCIRRCKCAIYLVKDSRQNDILGFFDYLLENANVVGTPGSGFGPSGEGYFRLTAFGTMRIQ